MESAAAYADWTNPKWLHRCSAVLVTARALQVACEDLHLEPLVACLPGASAVSHCVRECKRFRDKW